MFIRGIIIDIIIYIRNSLSCNNIIRRSHNISNTTYKKSPLCTLKQMVSLLWFSLIIWNMNLYHKFYKGSKSFTARVTIIWFGSSRARTRIKMSALPYASTTLPTLELILALLNFTTINAYNACFLQGFITINAQCMYFLLPIDHSIDNGKQKNDHLNLK